MPFAAKTAHAPKRKNSCSAPWNPVAESTKQCCRAYQKFTQDYPDYSVDVILCAFSAGEMVEAKKEFDKFMNI